MRRIPIEASTIAKRHMIGGWCEAGCEVAVVASSTLAQACAQIDGIVRATHKIADVTGAADIDAGDVALTNDEHFAQTMAAIAADKLVLNEKPLAMTVEQATIW